MWRSRTHPAASAKEYGWGAILIISRSSKTPLWLVGAEPSTRTGPSTCWSSQCRSAAPLQLSRKHVNVRSDNTTVERPATFHVPSTQEWTRCTERVHSRTPQSRTELVVAVPFEFLAHKEYISFLRPYILTNSEACWRVKQV